MPLCEIPHGVRNLVERVRPVEYRRDLAALDELLEDLQVSRVRGRNEGQEPLTQPRAGILTRPLGSAARSRRVGLAHGQAAPRVELTVGVAEVHG